MSFKIEKRHAVTENCWYEVGDASTRATAHKFCLAQGPGTYRLVKIAQPPFEVREVQRPALEVVEKE